MPNSFSRLYKCCFCKSNSAFASRNLSGSKRRGRQKTGAPEIIIWCVTFVLTGLHLLSSIMISLYSFNRCEKISFELHANTCAGSVVVMCVLFLISLLRLISTSRSKCFIKSAPIISESTSAIVNGHVNDWLRPMSRVRFLCRAYRLSCRLRCLAWCWLVVVRCRCCVAVVRMRCSWCSRSWLG